MRRCEEDSGCNVISRDAFYHHLTPLPWIISDENIDNDTETKMKTKMVSVPVHDETGLSKSVETFTGLVWVSEKQKLVAV